MRLMIDEQNVEFRLGSNHSQYRTDDTFANPANDASRYNNVFGHDWRSWPRGPEECIDAESGERSPIVRTATTQMDQSMFNRDYLDLYLDLISQVHGGGQRLSGDTSE
jgi:hypothetical protein